MDVCMRVCYVMSVSDTRLRGYRKTTLRESIAPIVDNKSWLALRTSCCARLFTFCSFTRSTQKNNLPSASHTAKYRTRTGCNKHGGDHHHNYHHHHFILYMHRAYRPKIVCSKRMRLTLFPISTTKNRFHVLARTALYLGHLKATTRRSAQNHERCVSGLWLLFMNFKIVCVCVWRV